MPPPYPDISPNTTQEVSVAPNDTATLSYTISVHDATTARVSCRVDIMELGDASGVVNLSFFMDFFPGISPAPPPPPVPEVGLKL